MKRMFLLGLLSVCMQILMAQTATIQHTVKRGESFASIASRYGITEMQLMEANPMCDKCHVGLTLTIKQSDIDENKEEREEQARLSVLDSHDYEEAKMLAISGEYKKTVKLFDKIIEEHQPQGILYLSRGICQYERGKWKKAIEDLERALVFNDLSNSERDEADEYLSIARKKRSEQLERRSEMWAGIAAATLMTAATVVSTVEASKVSGSTSNGYSGITPSGVVTDPTKLSQAQLNQLADPRFAAQQVMQKEYAEYQEFSRYNKKADGSTYSYSEYQALQAQAMIEAKEQGYDMLAELKEQAEQRDKEWDEERKKDKEAWFKRYGYDISTSSSTSTSKKTSNTLKTSSVKTNDSSIFLGSTNNTIKNDENLDSKQQFKNDPVSSDDYREVKKVTLYYRDGSVAKVRETNVPLYKKGAHYFIKIGNTYYPRQAPNWLRFRNAIHYGDNQLYYND